MRFRDRVPSKVSMLQVSVLQALAPLLTLLRKSHRNDGSLDILLEACQSSFGAAGCLSLKLYIPRTAS